MGKIAWNNAYSVGVEKIDGQHKRLIDLVNDLSDASSTGKTKEVIEKVLAGLVEYTQYHFGTEEELMGKHAYPDSLTHKKAHQDFVAKAADLVAKQKSGNVTIGIEVMTFLQNWLVEHISVVDKKFGAYLNTKGVK